MGKKYLHEIEGTAALATRAREPRQATMIDYDIARRSHEARLRLARRQAARDRVITESGRNALVQHERQQITLQDIVSEAYDPNRTVASFLEDAFARVTNAIVSHPLWIQAREGSLAGKDFGKLTDRQVVSAAAVSTVVGSAMIFIGM